MLDEAIPADGPDPQGAADDDDEGAFEGDAAAALAAGADPTDVRATLGNVATGLAEQLSSITEEMNKIRQELYGESGIGGIAKELEKLKAGGLGDLLDNDALDGVLGKARGGAAVERLRGTAGDRSGSGGASSGSSDPAGSGAGSEARRRGKDPEERDQELEALRRRLQDRRGDPQKKKSSSISMWEKIMLLVVVLVCLYAGSPFFRTSVKRAASSILGGEIAEGTEESEYAIEDDW